MEEKFERMDFYRKLQKGDFVFIHDYVLSNNDAFVNSLTTELEDLIKKNGGLYFSVVSIDSNHSDIYFNCIIPVTDLTAGVSLNSIAYEETLSAYKKNNMKRLNTRIVSTSRLPNI